MVSTSNSMKPENIWDLETNKPCHCSSFCSLGRADITPCYFPTERRVPFPLISEEGEPGREGTVGEITFEEVQI